MQHRDLSMEENVFTAGRAWLPLLSVLLEPDGPQERQWLKRVHRTSEHFTQKVSNTWLRPSQDGHSAAPHGLAEGSLSLQG